MKKKLTPQQKQLQADFDKMMRSHSKPLERGARAKGVTGISTLNKRDRPLLESNRVNREASLDTGHRSTQPRKQMQYTGDKVIGVALMHKSNYAPVFSSEAAIEVSTMRRG